MTALQFGKSEKLKSRKTIAAVFQKGKSLQKYPLKLHFISSDFDENQAPVKAGFAVPKRSFKKAVDRNRLKRQIREAYRTQKYPLIQQCISSGRSLSLVFLYYSRNPENYKVIDKSMKSLLYKLLETLAKTKWIWLFFACPLLLCSQVYLQIEKPNNPNTIKFSAGDYITVKTKSFPDQWRELRIEDVLYDQQVIVAEGDILTPEYILAVKIDKPGIRELGTKVMQFGVVWFVFAGILELTGKYEFGKDTAAIGGSALVFGFGTRSLLSKKIYRMGKNARLRIVDLRFSIDP